jgi:CubicO group peptidase (beta-lactamase class C family)
MSMSIEFRRGDAPMFAVSTFEPLRNVKGAHTRGATVSRRRAMPTEHSRSRLARWVVAAVAILAAGVAWLLRAPDEPADGPTLLQRFVAARVADGSAHHAVLLLASGDGRTVWAAAGPARPGGSAPLTVDTPIRIASITKLYTATVVMRLEEEGLLRLDDPLGRYLSAGLIENLVVVDGHDVSASITLRQLLTHRSGIADYYDGRGRDGATLYERFLGDPSRRWTVEETIDRARELGATSAPGTRTSYSDTNYQLLGKVIERVTGRALHTVYSELIFDPLGLSHTWLEGHAPDPLTADAQPAAVFDHGRDIDRVRANGSYWADGGIVSTPAEMVTFLRALHDGRLVRASTLARMHEWHSMGFPLDYGIGTMRLSLPRPLALASGLPQMWGHSGSTGSFLYRIDALDLYVAGTLDEAGSRAAPFILIARALATWRHAAPRTGEPEPLELKPHAFRPKFLSLT